jgi:hypothetical protein
MSAWDMEDVEKEGKSITTLKNYMLRAEDVPQW